MCWVSVSRHLGESWRPALTPSSQLGGKGLVPGQREERDRGQREASSWGLRPCGRGEGPGSACGFVKAGAGTASSGVDFQAKH